MSNVFHQVTSYKMVAEISWYSEMYMSIACAIVALFQWVGHINCIPLNHVWTATLLVVNMPASAANSIPAEIMMYKLFTISNYIAGILHG